MTLTHIVAMAENRVIGRAGGMPWHIPEDFKFFKRTTMGHTMIMGRKTFESIGKALPGRLTIVVSRGRPSNVEESENLRYCTDLQVAIELARSLSDKWGDEIFIAGGGEIYKQSIDLVDRIYLTRVRESVAGDTFYPEFDRSEFDERLLMDGSQPVPFDIYVYDRRATRTY